MGASRAVPRHQRGCRHAGGLTALPPPWTLAVDTSTAANRGGKALPESQLTFPKDIWEKVALPSLDAEGSQTTPRQNALLGGEKLRGDKTLSYFTRAKLKSVALKSPGRQRGDPRRSNCFTWSQLCPGPLFLARKRRPQPPGLQDCSVSEGHRVAAVLGVHGLYGLKYSAVFKHFRLGKHVPRSILGVFSVSLQNSLGGHA